MNQKITLSCTFSSEKLRALRAFCAKKDIQIETEVALFLEQKYVKYVPKSVRDYIDFEPDFEKNTHAGHTKNAREAAVCHADPHAETGGNSTVSPTDTPENPGLRAAFPSDPPYTP